MKLVKRWEVDRSEYTAEERRRTVAVLGLSFWTDIGKLRYGGTSKLSLEWPHKNNSVKRGIRVFAMGSARIYNVLKIFPF
jgi:hypothetical protein